MTAQQNGGTTFFLYVQQRVFFYKLTKLQGADMGFSILFAFFVFCFLFFPNPISQT